MRLGKKPLLRLMGSLAILDAEPPYSPFISIHVACCNEPPELVIETINNLLRMAYPWDRFEVIVISNNTSDDSLWMPIAMECSRLRKVHRPVHFWHFPELPGAKAGALNFAIEVMDKRAEVICVMDCDFHFLPWWAPKFAKLLMFSNVGFVQMGQDYRDMDETSFKRLVYPYYRCPSIVDFLIRNEDGAAFPIGSMCLLNASAVKAVGGWPVGSVTEDYAIGLMLRAHGYHGYFFPDTCGSGLMTSNFAELSKQRFRWNVGPLQILRKHINWFLPWRSPLAEIDRKWEMNLVYKYADSFFVDLFVNIAIAASIILSYMSIEVPIAVHAAVALMWLRRVIKTIRTYRLAGNEWSQIPGIFLVGNALTHTRTKAVVCAILGVKAKFHRANKFKEEPGGVLRALGHAKEEVCLGSFYGALGVALCSVDVPLSLTTFAGVLALHKAYKYMCAFVVGLFK